MNPSMRKITLFFIILFLFLELTSCNSAREPDPALPNTNADEAEATAMQSPFVPQADRWGIYRLDLASQMVELIFSSPSPLSVLRLNHHGDQFVFSQKVGGDANVQEEHFTLRTDGSNLQRISDNQFWDLYPVWSPDDARIAFLSDRSGSLGIYLVNADGSDPGLVIDSTAHESDLDWVGNLITFTRDSRIWLMQSDGDDPHPITSPPRAGEWGAANLPFGDYDPRISPDGTHIVFERLWDDTSPHGIYDHYSLDLESSQEVQLTSSGYSQGLASWSNSGQQLVYIVSAVDQIGQYDLYLMDADGSNQRNITPVYFPTEFLCHWAIFSSDDADIFFIGEWWQAD